MRAGGAWPSRTLAGTPLGGGRDTPRGEKISIVYVPRKGEFLGFITSYKVVYYHIFIGYRNEFRIERSVGRKLLIMVLGVMDRSTLRFGAKQTV